MFFIFLFLLNFALFFPSLGAYFFLDDADWLVHARDIAANPSLLMTPEGGRTRPLLLLIYHAQYKLFGLNAAPYHVCNVLVHFGNACLVYVLARKLSTRLPLHAQQKSLFPVLSSILFSVLFAHYQPVVWVNFISESLCALFVLVSLFLLLTMTEIKKISLQIGMLFLSVLFFALSLLTKESSYGYPFVVYFAISLLSPSHKKSAWFFAAPFFIVAALHIYLTGNAGFITVSQQQDLTAAAPALGLHFIPVTLDCLTDLLISLTGIVRIPGFSGLASGLFGAAHGVIAAARHAVTFVLFFLLLLFIYAFKKKLSSGTLPFSIKNIFRARVRGSFMTPELSLSCFCLFSMFFLFLPNSFFFYLYTQTGASFARYRYLYLPSAAFCLAAGYFFSKPFGGKPMMKTLFASALFAVVCAVNMLNTLVMENYHIMQGMKVRKYADTLKTLKPPLRSGDTVVMLDFPGEESLLQSFHLKAYAALLLNKNIEVKWQAYGDPLPLKKNMHVIYFNKTRAHLLQ